MAFSRVAAVATLRYREGVRGPLIVFLAATLVLAAAAAIFVPGEPGPERQRAVDRLVFDAILFVSALAAATLGAGPDPADRAAGRDLVLGAGPLRPWEGLVGAWLGHGTGLLLLLVGALAGSLAITGLLTGGDEHRPATRVAVEAAALTGPDGSAAEGPVLLDEPGRAAIFTVPSRSDGPDRPEVTVRIAPLSARDSSDYPEFFPVGVRVGEGELREFRVRRGDPLRFRPAAGESVARIEVRRLGPTYALALFPDGLLVEGAPRSRTGNLAKALAAWLGGLMILAAAAAALGTCVQAPVAVFGTLLVALVGRSLGLLETTAGFLADGGTGGGIAAGLVGSVAAAWPDFAAADLFDPVVAGWDIEPSRLGIRALATAGGASVCLAVAWTIVALRRRQ